MKNVVMMLCFLILWIPLEAATSESEPNDAVNDVNVITINTPGEYTGAVLLDGGGGSSDSDYWKFAAGTSALNFDLSESPSDVTFSLYCYSDAGYTVNEGVVNVLTGGTDPPAESGINSSKYYALLIATGSGGNWDYSFQIEEDSSLPIELTTFSAKEIPKGVLLEWTTESEIDNLGFLLERKTDDTDWIEITSYLTDDALKGAGNSSSKLEYAFIDDDVLPGQTYSYRLSDVDTEGNVTAKDMITISIDSAPVATDLMPAVPNPFNPSTKIQYTLAKNLDVTLRVINMTGQTVQTIINGQKQTAGSYSVHWNGKNKSGLNAPSGIYILVMNAGQVIKSQKVMLVR